MTHGKPESEQTEVINQTEENKAGDANVDQIRDILFGSQMVDFDRKFSNLEQRLLYEVTQIKEESNTRFDSLESVINKEVGLLSEKINLEKQSRNKSIEELFAELNNTANAVQNKLDELENNTETELMELRESIVNQSKNLLAEISHQHQQSTTAFDQSVSKLKQEKLNRASLSALLSDLAMRITDDSGNEKNDH